MEPPKDFSSYDENVRLYCWPADPAEPRADYSAKWYKGKLDPHTVHKLERQQRGTQLLPNTEEFRAAIRAMHAYGFHIEQKKFNHPF